MIMDNNLESIRADLQTIFRRVFADDELTLRDEMTSADIDGWDSMTTISLVVAICKFFGIHFTLVEMTELKADGQNIGTLALAIQRKLGAKQ
jgi:acyl carrier protein